jgi:hypothetical protein
LSKARQAKHVFVIRGQSLSLSRQRVLEKLKSVKPGVYTEHVVQIDGVWHPLKKAFAIATGLDLLKFHTAQALTVFEKLGFKVDRMSNRER